ncbi:hypothetical protein PENSOL_c027G06909 [Penicillium solitum]|uniref:Lactonase n=1 Tax=Penicillium solitum TaxID=60172 RepID=A0A1V6QYD2_9EURO|nr:uncharacterized protein PENSOL_c027G06909 [Penicillium solitum]OQD94193.1 hypothetical protein PENSOL_c027G06909 [Penicillium solitum]
MRPIILSTILFGAASMATKLYAASYSGTVTTLSPQRANGSYELSIVAQTKDCGTSPSWLTLDNDHDLMLCLNEGLGASNGSLTSFRVNSNGSLTTLDVLETVSGPVMSAPYTIPGQPRRRFVAVAHYSGSAVTAYTLDSASGYLHRAQTFTYELAAPGPIPDRQDASHPHGAIVDPTGRFVLVPDLGMDRIHIFKISPSSGLLQPQKPLLVKPGSGPRHAVFWTPKTNVTSTDDTFLYLVSELGNTLTAFKANYTRNGVTFVKVHEESTYGGEVIPSGSKASGIHISPENDRIVVSNRGDATFGKNGDSFAVFTCITGHGNHANDFSFVGLFPAYGSFPREFEINGHNGVISVALQNSHEVALVQWDKQTRRPGKLLAKKSLDGEIPAAIWGP